MSVLQPFVNSNWLKIMSLTAAPPATKTGFENGDQGKLKFLGLLALDKMAKQEAPVCS